MFDQYGKPIVETYDRNGNLIIGGVSIAVKSMSRQEKRYLDAMADTAQAYLTSIVVIANQLQPGFDDYDNEYTAKYLQILEKNLSVAKKLRSWAINNKDMDHFPANYDELNDAKTLAALAKHEFLSLRNEYRKILGKDNCFLSCPDQSQNLTQVGLKSERLYVLILDAQGAVSEDKYTVDPKKLNDLPPEH